LGNGQVLAEGEFLVDHRHAGPQRVGRRLEANRLATNLDPTIVGEIDARQNPAERALAGAVLAAERMAGAARDLECHVLERHDAREPLRDALERNSWLSHRIPLKRTRGWPRTGPPRSPGGDSPATGAFGAEDRGPRRAFLCAVGWPRVGLSADRTRHRAFLIVNDRYGRDRYDSGTSVKPQALSWRAQVPRLSFVTLTSSIGLMTGTSFFRCT